MASKTGFSSSKRKASAAVKSDGRVKKPKLGATRQPFHGGDSDEDQDGGAFGASSDSEDGGAKLTPQRKEKKQLPYNNSKHSKAPSENNSGKPGKTFERGESSRESHAIQKRLAQERKAQKPLADELHRTKKIWEKLRLKSHVAKEERQQLVDELFEIITGRIKDFVLKHDAVRAVQTAIKYSTPERRKQIAAELKGTYAQLAEGRYAKFLIGKLLVQNDDEIRDLIIPEFYGKVRKLINHPEASWILDDIYRGVATKEQKALLLREWYGPEFALFRNEAQNGEEAAAPTAELFQILTDEPSKRGPILKYLLDMINPLVQKKMTGFTMLHDAMLQYFLNIKPDSEEGKEFMEIIKEDESGDLLKNMAFTKSGARLSCLLLAYGTAKDRKTLLKTYKDTFHLMCGDPYGHVVILTAYEVIDDTVMVGKAIFPEILGKSEQSDAGNIVFCANNLNARTAILYLFEGQSRSLFPASHAGDLQVLDEIRGIREHTSKKDPEIRRRELISAISAQLLAHIAACASDLVATAFGCHFVAEALLSTTGDKTEALQAVAAIAGGDPEQADAADIHPPPPPHISTTPAGARMFKTLIAGGRFDKESGKVKRVEPALNFADMFYDVIKEHVLTWATGPGSFTIVGLLEAEDFSHADDLNNVLRKNKKALSKAVNDTQSKPKADSKKQSDGGGKKQIGKKGKQTGAAAKQEQRTGNQGAKLLLEKLQG